jgi:hypothetical protein
MMTNEQILELAKTCGFDSFTGEKENFWECWEEQLLNFALVIHEYGYNKGYGEAWREGYNVGVIEYQE